MLALPRLSLTGDLDRRCLRVLARGDHCHDADRAATLDRVLGLLGIQAPVSGTAALRLLGQTGSAPGGWIAAADPVHMETCIDHLRVHALAPSSVPVQDLKTAFERLQAQLGEPDALLFRHVAGKGYLEAEDDALETPRASALVVDGYEPSQFMPAGTDQGGGQRFHRLHSEVQMVLHDAALLADDQQRGALPVNALWIWGGGRLPEATPVPLPDLYSDDDLVTGFWRAAGAGVQALPRALSDCINGDDKPRVIVAEHAADDVLAQAVDLLGTGRIRRLMLLLNGGKHIDLRRSDRFRFWRRHLPELDV
ncbi:MAG: hypothetical protein AAGA61_02100 [Pseudomonadota bacterium]